MSVSSTSSPSPAKDRKLQESDLIMRKYIEQTFNKNGSFTDILTTLKELTGSKVTDENFDID